MALPVRPCPMAKFECPRAVSCSSHNKRGLVWGITCVILMAQFAVPVQAAPVPNANPDGIDATAPSGTVAEATVRVAAAVVATVSNFVASNASDIVSGRMEILVDPTSPGSDGATGGLAFAHGLKSAMWMILFIWGMLATYLSPKREVAAVGWRQRFRDAVGPILFVGSIVSALTDVGARANGIVPLSVLVHWILRIRGTQKKLTRADGSTRNLDRDGDASSPIYRGGRGGDK
eukprot:GHVS01062209.1.p1 GENE.GHVS01062209.1~~GHVS01062209.1.p1  ORF type:complete len:233 (+),score=11.43 GHVS01062209.1:33-731(+)